MTTENIAHYNFKNHTKGDTFDGVLFTLKKNGVAVDLSVCTITMDMRLTALGAIAKSFTSAGSGGITIDADPTSGKFVLDAQIIDIAAGTYMFDMQFLFDDTPDVVKTYIKGNWTILQDITYS